MDAYPRAPYERVVSANSQVREDDGRSTDKCLNIPDRVDMISTTSLSLKLVHDNQWLFLGINKPRENQIPRRCWILRDRFGWVDCETIELDFQVLEVVFQAVLRTVGESQDDADGTEFI